MIWDDAASDDLWKSFCVFPVFRADKIPAAQYSSYVESCLRQRQQDRE